MGSDAADGSQERVAGSNGTVALDRPSPRKAAPSPLVITLGLIAAVGVAAWLRLDHLGATALSPDETYSAVSAHLPWTQIPRWIADTDPHPPLSYLLLHLVAAGGASDFAMRLLPTLCSIAAVVVMAWWQRRRGWEGLAATVLLAVMPFQLMYGREARMYGLLALAGVVAAAACWRWLGDPSRSWALLAAVAGLVSALSHGMGFVLLPGLFLLPGRRRDRAAWEWRASMVGAGVIFALVWGWVLLRGPVGTTYSNRATWKTVTVSLNELVAAVPANRLFVLSLLVGGMAVLWVVDRRMAHVVICAGLVPAVLVILLGLREPVVMPKSFVVVGWMAPVLIAAVCGVLGRRSPMLGCAAFAAVLLLVLPWIGPSSRLDEGTSDVVAALRPQVEEGDVVAMHPDSTVIRWYLADDRPGREHLIDVGIDGTKAFLVGDGPWNGRVWLVDSTYLEPAATVDAPSCAAPVTFGSFQLRCLELDPGSAQPLPEGPTP